ncbi:MAG: PAS domain-containing protein [Bacillota bacterium]
MGNGEWIKDFPGAVTVCDTGGKIIEMNEKACKMFEKDGGAQLIGKNVFDCHPERAREILKGIMESKSLNCYTIEKNGVKKLIYQSPWYKEGKFMGLVELGLEIPDEIPHFKRD